MSACIVPEIDAFMNSAIMQQLPRNVQAKVFESVAQHYSSIYQQLQANSVDSDWGNYELSTYDTLYTRLKAKQNDLEEEGDE